jgi:hypothetical protein
VRRRAAVGATVALLLGVSATACADAEGDASAWTQVTEVSSGMDFAHPDVPLDELVVDAELTVVAEFGEVIGERQLAEDFAYVQIELVIREVVAGDAAAGDVLTFEGWTSEVTEVPTGEMLMFLHEKVSDVDPPGLWVWHTSRGIWAETDRATIDTPIAEDPPVQSNLYRDDIGGASTLSDVVTIVEEIARR